MSPTRDPAGDRKAKPPSVTILTKEYPPHIYGGAGIHAQHLAAALAGLTRVEVRCFGPGEPAGPVAARSFAPELPWLAGADGRLAGVLGTMATDLAMLAPPIDTDVVHCHTWYTLFAGHLARMLYHKPLVATVHSLEPLRPWKEEQLGPGYQLSTWLERTGLLAADLVIAVSAGMRADILRTYPVAPERVRVVHNGVDAGRFKKTGNREALARYGLTQPYLLFVGRVSRQKGLDVLLDAAPCFPPGLTVAVCAGAADTPELAAEIRGRARKLPNVRWIEEMVPVEDLVQLYSHAAVFVCPSVYEPFGLINLEAMACGCPVVASAVGGIPEVVADGLTGLLVPAGDAEALAGAVRDVLTAPERAASIGAAGRRRVEERFTWEEAARRTIEVYEEAMGNYMQGNTSRTTGIYPAPVRLISPARQPGRD